MGRFDSSSNPLLSEERLMHESRNLSYSDGGAMTKEGAINKTVILIGVMLLTAAFAYSNPSTLLMWGGMLGGIVVYFITSRKPTLAPTTAPIFAGLEGLLVGSISAVYAAAYSGIIFQAVSITISILLVMLIIYRSGWIPVTQRLKTGIAAATGGIMLVYLLSIVLSFFGMSVPFLHQGGMIGIGISLFIIVIASLNLLLDFDRIDEGDKMGLPKYMEWFMGMGLLFTLVWIYIEVLRLLAVLARE